MKPGTYIVSTRKGSMRHQNADSRVKDMTCLEWIHGKLYRDRSYGPEFKGKRLCSLIGAEARFPTLRETEEMAIEKLLEHGKRELKADAYELTGTIALKDDENPGLYFGYATAIFYKSE